MPRYMSEHQTDCDTQLLPLIYLNYVIVQKSIKMSSLSLALTGNPLHRIKSYQNESA